MNKLKTLMIKKIVIICVILFLSSLASASQITVAWDPNTEIDLAGYRAWAGEVSGSYTIVEDVGTQTHHTFMGLTEGTEYYVAVTAYDVANNESDYSQEVSHIANSRPPVPPTGLRTKLKELAIDILNILLP